VKYFGLTTGLSLQAGHDDISGVRVTDRDRRSSLIKEVNARVRELNSRSEVPGSAGFFCECGRPGCTDILDLSVADYDVLRAKGDGFLVKSGHQAATPELEHGTTLGSAPDTAIAPA